MKFNRAFSIKNYIEKEFPQRLPLRTLILNNATNLLSMNNGKKRKKINQKESPLVKKEHFLCFLDSYKCNRKNKKKSCTNEFWSKRLDREKMVLISCWPLRSHSSILLSLPTPTFFLQNLSELD
jgi:hypothetical protein